MKKIMTFLLALSLLITAASAGFAAQAEPMQHALEKRSVPVYYSTLNDYRSLQEMTVLEDFPLYYADGAGDLPFVDLTDFVRLMNSMDVSGGIKEGYIGRTDDEAEVFTCSWEPLHSDVSIDFKNKTLTYTSVDTFGKNPEFSPMEIQTDNLEFLQRSFDPKRNRVGGEKTVPLGDYGIDLFIQDGLYLLPLHTAFDFLLWVPNVPSMVLFCNQTAVFLGEHSGIFGFSDALSSLGEVYYSAKPAERSDKLAQYGYNELCLVLDCFYGLKDSHHIESFDSFFRANGYKEAFLSRDPKEADQALFDLITGALDDQHSDFVLASWMSGKDYYPKTEKGGFTSSLYAKKQELFERALQKSFPGGMKFYMESGNTAYVTLSLLSTTITSERFYSESLKGQTPGSINDPLEQILYAHQQITRENSPIENVVLDLSLCPGGDANTAACVLSWFLGEGVITIADSFSGGLGISTYRADINRDHQFTDEDSLLGKKKLFCLISPLTFSSGNLTAAMLKNSGFVTLLGQESAGGSGLKTSTVTAWDTSFTLSGFRTVATVKNGSWYDADPGVVPDVYLSDPELFYQREKLTELINSF